MFAVSNSYKNTEHKFDGHKWLATHVADTLNSTSTLMAILLMSLVFNSKHGYGYGKSQ